MPDTGPATVEGAIGQYTQLLVGALCSAGSRTAIRHRWDKVRARLDGLQKLAGVNSAQDARYGIEQVLAKARDRVMELDLREEIDTVLSELRSDMVTHGVGNKRSIEELCE